MRTLLWRWGLLALLTVPWRLALAQTLPNRGFPTPEADADHQHHDHFFEQLRADPRLTTGRLLDAAMPLTTPTTTKVFSFDCQCITLHLQKK